MMVFIGVFAYVMRRLGFPLPPLVLGIVLGKLLDEYMRQALMISDGSLMPLVERPICLVLLLILIAFTLLGIPAVRRGVRRLMLPSMSQPAGLE